MSYLRSSSLRPALLDSSSPRDLALLNASQLQLDSLTTLFSEEASNASNLFAMVGGGFIYRACYAGLRSLGAWKGVAFVGSLTAEVTGYRAGTQFFTRLRGENISEDLFDRKAWWGNFVSFALLKGGAALGQRQNAALVHLLQSSAMVAGSHLAYGLRLSYQPQGSILEQLLHAEVTNLAMMGGNSLLSNLSGHALTRLERSLEWGRYRNETGTRSRFKPSSASSVRMASRVDVVVNGLMEKPRELERMVLGDFPLHLSAEYGGDGNFVVLGSGLRTNLSNHEANYFPLKNEFINAEHVVLGVHESGSYSLFRLKGSRPVHIETKSGDWKSLAEEAWEPLNAGQRFALGEVYSHQRDGQRRHHIPSNTLVLSADGHLNLKTWSPETPFQQFLASHHEFCTRIHALEELAQSLKADSSYTDFLNWIRSEHAAMLANDKLAHETLDQTRPYLSTYLRTLHHAREVSYRWNETVTAEGITRLMTWMLEVAEKPGQAAALNELLRAYPQSESNGSPSLSQKLQDALAERLKKVVEGMPARFLSLGERVVLAKNPARARNRMEQDFDLSVDDSRHMHPYADWWIMHDAAFEDFLTRHSLPQEGAIYVLGGAGGRLALQLARRGYANHTIDISSLAIRRLQMTARVLDAQKTLVETSLADATTYPFIPTRLFMVNVWEFLSPAEKTRLVRHMTDSWVEGGKIYFSFSLNEGPRFEWMRTQAWQYGIEQVSPNTFRSERITPSRDRVSLEKHYYSREEILAELSSYGLDAANYEIEFHAQEADSQGFVQASVEISRRSAR